MPESVEKGRKRVVRVESKESKQEEDQRVAEIIAQEDIYKKKMKDMKLENMKKSKNGFPEMGLFVRSHVKEDGTCAYACPLPNCTKVFISPHTCDAHINRHLGYEYGPCPKCGYTNPSRDSYDKHTYFAGAKMGGKRPASRGEAAKKRVSEAAGSASSAAKKKKKN